MLLLFHFQALANTVLYHRDMLLLFHSQALANTVLYHSDILLLFHLQALANIRQDIQHVGELNRKDDTPAQAMSIILQISNLTRDACNQSKADQVHKTLFQLAEAGAEVEEEVWNN